MNTNTIIIMKLSPINKHIFSNIKSVYNVSDNWFSVCMLLAGVKNSVKFIPRFNLKGNPEENGWFLTQNDVKNGLAMNIINELKNDDLQKTKLKKTQEIMIQRNKDIITIDNIKINNIELLLLLEIFAFELFFVKKLKIKKQSLILERTEEILQFILQIKDMKFLHLNQFQLYTTKHYKT